MVLPETEDELFWDEIEQCEKEKNMPHMTRIERRGREQGLEQGLERGRTEGQVKMLLRALERRFQVAVPEELAARILATTDRSLLDQWFDWTYEAASLDDFQKRIQTS
jgi:flagellar biosynthesis/type III secretory pathway protein FliH